MSFPKIRPRSKWVFVKPNDEVSNTSKNGLITPSNVEQKKKSVGTALAIGEGIKDIKKGDRVIYGEFAGENIQIENMDYKLLHDDDIIAFYS